MPRGKPIAPQNNPAVHADRKRQAWELYKGGLTNLTEIGRQLGLNKSTVCRYIQRTLAELASQDLADAEQYRRTELARLDGQLLDLARIAFNKDLPLPDRLRGHEVMLKVADRRAKLLGLDKPLKVADTDTEGNDKPGSMTAEQLRKEVEAILASGRS